MTDDYERRRMVVLGLIASLSRSLDELEGELRELGELEKTRPPKLKTNKRSGAKLTVVS
jgi:hypothetical protein